MRSLLAVSNIYLRSRPGDLLLLLAHLGGRELLLLLGALNLVAPLKYG